MEMPIRTVFARSFRIPSKNPKIALFVILLALIPRSLLYFSKYILQKALLADVTTTFTVLQTLGVEFNGPAAKPLLSKIFEDAKALMTLLAITIVIAYIVSVFEWIVVVHFANATILEKQVTPRDLLSKAIKSWRGTLLTFLLATVLLSGYLGLLINIYAFFVLVLYGSWVLMALTLLVLTIPALASLIYVGFVCDLARVISIVEEEDGCYGVAALAKAMRILKGKRMKGFLLALVLLGFTFVVFVLHGMMSAGVSSKVPVVLRAVFLGLQVLLRIYILVVCSLFYQYCKKSDGEAFLGNGELEISYNKLPMTG